MKVLGVVGPSAADRRALVERLAGHLDGRVGTVRQRRRGDAGDAGADPDRPAGVATSVGLSDGEWVAAGAGMTLDDALDELAPGHDYALVAGFPDADLPQVVVGDVDHDGEALVAAPTADDVDVDAVVDAIVDVEPRETLASLVARVKRSPREGRAGAIATFTGRVRARDGPDDSRTECLEFEKYEGVAGQRMTDIASELEDRDGVLDVALHHRTGVIEAGEDIVFVVVLAGHRREAFRAVEDGIDRLKDEVPLFKKEVTVEDTFWRHERE